MNLLLTKKILAAIKDARHILLLTDERIDGDTMGSTMGLYHALCDFGKHVDVYSPKPLPPIFAYLPNVNVIQRTDSVLTQDSIDLAIVCDCSDGAYLPPVLAKIPHKVPLIAFDHHATNPRYGTINVIEPKAASTADVVRRFLQAAEFSISPKTAQCLLTGIVTDTQVFFSANTTQAAMEAAAELTALGANLHDIIQYNFVNKSAASLKLWGLAMERLQKDEVFGGISTALTQRDLQENQATSDDIQGISNFLNAVLDESHDVIVVYRELENGDIKGSARARTKDVASIAQKLYGGGGHKLAAGFVIERSRIILQGNTWKIAPDQQNKKNSQ